MICLGNTSHTICRCRYKLSKQRFTKALLRFRKQLPFIYLKKVFVNCLSSVLEKLLKCLGDVFLKCLNNAFVRHCLDLRKSPFRHLENISRRCLAVLAIKLLDILQMYWETQTVASGNSLYYNNNLYKGQVNCLKS